MQLRQSAANGTYWGLSYEMARCNSSDVDCRSPTIGWSCTGIRFYNKTRPKALRRRAGYHMENCLSSGPDGFPETIDEATRIFQETNEDHSTIYRICCRTMSNRNRRGTKILREMIHYLFYRVLNPIRFWKRHQRDYYKYFLMWNNLT